MFVSNETGIRLRTVAILASCFIAAVAIARAQESTIRIGGGGGVQWSMKGDLTLPRTRDWDDYDCRFHWNIPGSLIGYTLHADAILPNLFFRDSFAMVVRVSGTFMQGRASYKLSSGEASSPRWDGTGGEVRADYSLALVNLDLLIEYPLPQRFLLRAGPSLGYFYKASGDVVRVRYAPGHADGFPSENVETRNVYSGEWRGKDLTVGASAMIALQQPIGDRLTLVPELGIRWDMNTSQSNSKVWPGIAMHTGVTALYTIDVDNSDATSMEPPLP